jgi:integral membrane protein
VSTNDLELTDVTDGAEVVGEGGCCGGGCCDAPAGGLSPLRVYRFVAVAEACTWAGLLVGMFLKRVTHTTDLGVQIGGMLHGVVFIAFCLTTLVVAIDQGWTKRRTLAGLASAIPPFATIWFDRNAEKHGLLDDVWHSSETSPTAPQRAVSWLLGHPLLALAFFIVALAGLTAVALLVGPPGN